MINVHKSASWLWETILCSLREKIHTAELDICDLNLVGVVTLDKVISHVTEVVSDQWREIIHTAELGVWYLNPDGVVTLDGD